MPATPQTGPDELRELKDRCAQLQSALESLVGVIQRLEESRAPSRPHRPERPGPRAIPRPRELPSRPPGRVHMPRKKPSAGWTPPRKPAPLARKDRTTLVSRRRARQSVAELLLGERWLRRIGGTILLVGVIFLLKHAYDQGWLNPVILAALGVSAGILLVGGGFLALCFGWRSVSDVLSALGTATLYFALARGHDADALYPGTLALAAYGFTAATLLALTCATGQTGVLYLATVGAFVAPWGIAKHYADGAGLALYLFLITLAVQVIGIARRLEALRIISWLGTAALLGVWRYYHPDPAPAAHLGLTLIFYIVFQIDALMTLDREDHPPVWAVVPVIHLNNLALFGSIVHLYHEQSPAAMTVLCLLMAVSQWLLAGRIKTLDLLPRQIKRALRLDGAIMLACFAPIHFDGYLVTLLWAEQAVLTAWFVRRLFGPWPALYTAGIMTAAMVHLVWIEYPNEEMTHPWTILHVFDFTWITILTAFVALCSYLTAVLLVAGRTTGPWEKRLGKLLTTCATGLLIWMVMEGTDRYAATWWWMALATIWCLIARRRPAAVPVALALSSAVTLKFTLWDTAGSLLDETWSDLHGVIVNRAVLTGVLLSFLSLITLTNLRRLPTALAKKIVADGWRTVFTLVAALALLWTGTFEILRIFTFEDARLHYVEMGLSLNLVLSIFWAIGATIFLTLGLALRRQSLRYLAISLFALTVIKVLVVDFAFLETLYRVISLLTLGFMMLLASLIYQRLSASAMEPEAS